MHGPLMLYSRITFGETTSCPTSTWSAATISSRVTEQSWQADQVLFQLVLEPSWQAEQVLFKLVLQEELLAQIKFHFKVRNAHTW